MFNTAPKLAPSEFPAINRSTLQVLQVNLGYLCNLSCSHCHVNAGPKRTELMDRQTIDLVCRFIQQTGIHSLDLTGGAPEMNPHFCDLVQRARIMQVKVIDRCNLVILEQPEYAEMAEFLAANQVEITASLPCYLEENVDNQRGEGTFKSSLAALKRLNALGYGQADSNLQLNLVFNPQGINLPPDQVLLEQAYKEHLQSRYGIVFNKLFAMTNLPIQRFRAMLMKQGLYDQYLQSLIDHYRSENLDQVMCRNTLSIDWQGYVYDCDFNQMLKLPLGAFPQTKTHLTDLLATTIAAPSLFTGAAITVREHCYGCTAGQGSSCGGALGK
ncbi:MAG: arsenosugar biosynthesis radical SAM (seleno)protein ArsS [Methylococcales bacterium]